MTSRIRFLNEEMRITCSMKKMKKFDVLVKMKIVIDCKKNKNTLPLMNCGLFTPNDKLDSRLWNKENGDHM